MDEQLKQFVLINKEDVINLKFPKDEVLKSSDEIKMRRMELERATVLGNAEHGKIKIFFHDDQGAKKVETTIWATTEKNITLKGGMCIPIHRIFKVSIY